MTDYRDCPKCGERVSPVKYYGPHLSAHTRSENAKYRYLNGDTKHPYEFKSCLNPDCGVVDWIQTRNDFCSRRCSRLGEFNPNWRSSSAYKIFSRTQLVGWHQTVYSLRGQPSYCEHCQMADETRVYHWANVTGDYANPEDYIRLCAPCHYRFDLNKPIVDFSEVTMSDDSIYKKGPSKGSAHFQAKLTEDDVTEILRRCQAGEGPQAIAEDYPVTPSVICNIKARRIWKHVPAV